MILYVDDDETGGPAFFWTNPWNGKREKLALTTTKTIMRSQLVTLHADKIQLTNLKHEIVLHNNVHLDGKKVAANTTKHQDRAKRKTAPQRTGRYAGTSFLVQG